MTRVSEVKALQADVRTALDAVAAKHGLAITKNNASYGDDTVRVSVTFETAVAGENTYKRYAEMWGLEKDWFGKEFKSRGRGFIIVGLNQKARSKPVICRGDDGREYVFPADTVIRHMGGKPRSLGITEKPVPSK